MDLFINQWKVCSHDNKISFANREILLQPLCMSLLLYLSKKPGVVVERQEIIEQVWLGRIVSEDALNNSIGKIRRALGDDAKQPQLIETINKKGYRLIAEVNNKAPRTTVEYRPLTMTMAVLGFLSICLIVWQPIKVDMVTIRSDMSEQEKEIRYQAIRSQTVNGGHILKLDIPSS